METKKYDLSLFLSQVAQQKCILNNFDDTYWKYYDCGPKDAKTPLVFLTSTVGTAEIYFQQLLYLSSKGYRVISVQYPPINSHNKWIRYFDRFIDTLKVEKIHLFGASLGGYLAQCYTQYSPTRVKSLILCNSYCDNQYYNNNAPCLSIVPYMPEFLIRKLITSNVPLNPESEYYEATKFMLEQLDGLDRDDLISRIQLYCKLGPLNPEDLPLNNEAITIIDTLDDTLVPEKLKLELSKFYPGSREALLKSGGDFPFLTRPEEVNMYIEVHLRENE